MDLFDNAQRFTNTNGLYGNHFRFHLDGLPHLTFFAQSVALPSVMSVSVDRGTPFTKIRETGDALNFGTFDVSYLIDAQFYTYFSLYYWLRGYGFPNSYEDIKQFQEQRKQRIMNPRPQFREVHKTNALLSILQPDTETTLVEIQYTDVFPVAIGELRFETTDGDAPQLHAAVTFACTMFDVVLTD